MSPRLPTRQPRPSNGSASPKGIEARVWAAEPLLANPVSFCFDEKGRCYVAETFRLHHGVTDNRGHMDWLDDDLACRTVADRVAMYQQVRSRTSFAKDYESEHDRVRSSRTPRAPARPTRPPSSPTASTTPPTASAPASWRARATSTTPASPTCGCSRTPRARARPTCKQSLRHGFGVHVAFLGHDMHGLRMGPDGKLYFSIGDRGLNVTTKEGKHLFNPDSGAVLRCDPDGVEPGSRPHRPAQPAGAGLRRATATCSPWTTTATPATRRAASTSSRAATAAGAPATSIGSDLSDRGPFNAEKIWHLPHGGAAGLRRAAAAPTSPTARPACASTTAAPRLPERYKDHFFICDFRGGSGGSGVYSFAVKPKGASFEVVDGHQFIWSRAGDRLRLRPRRRLLRQRLGRGLGLTGKGRIYRFADAEAGEEAGRRRGQEAAGRRLRQALERRTGEAAGAHRHARAARRRSSPWRTRARRRFAASRRCARRARIRLARLHAVWGLGQIGRKDETAA